MKIQLATIGGYSEVGRNMSALKINNEVIIMDMGFFLPAIIDHEEEQESLTTKDMRRIGAIPDDTFIKDWAPLVKAIVVSHAHLDHIGAIPYLAKKYDCPIYGTPFAIEVINSISKDKRIKIKNPLRKVNINGSIKISPNITIEFINITHSTPHTVLIAINTPAGAVLYCNDFKFDNNPIIGKKPNYEKIKSFKKVLAVICDSIYADADRKTPSENVAREMLKDVLLGVENKNNAIIVTSFSSHIARLKSVMDFASLLKRKVVFLGRSLNKYISAAENAGLVNFSRRAEIVAYRKKIDRKLKLLKKNRRKYLIVCTGSQGEKNAVLTRMAQGAFKFKPEDNIIFSCKVIPDPRNIAARKKLESHLKKSGMRIFKDIHVSGHAGREDLRDLIKLTNPKLVIPAHVAPDKAKHLCQLSKEMRYRCQVSKNGNIITIS